MTISAMSSVTYQGQKPPTAAENSKRSTMEEIGMVAVFLFGILL